MLCCLFDVIVKMYSLGLLRIKCMGLSIMNKWRYSDTHSGTNCMQNQEIQFTSIYSRIFKIAAVYY